MPDFSGKTYVFFEAIFQTFDNLQMAYRQQV